MAEQLARFTPENPLHELQRVNHMGSQIFTCLLFPRRFKHPEYVLTPGDKQRVVDYWKNTKKGIQITTRRDDVNYDVGNDGKFAFETGYIEPEDIWQEFGFEFDEATVQPIELLKVDPNVLPSAKHASVTIGILNELSKVAPKKLPFINEFPYEGRRFWGRSLNVSTMYQMVDQLDDLVSSSLQGEDVSNYEILPAAQFFNVGSRISTSILRQAYFREKYRPLPKE